MPRPVFWLLVFLTTLSLLSFTIIGCKPEATPEQERDRDVMPSLSAVALNQDARLRVVATTSSVADVVKNVGGDLIELGTLMPLGTDPHTFEPVPLDVAAVADAHVVFVNGAGLEEFLSRLLESAGQDVIVVPVSVGIELLEFEGQHQEHEKERHREGDADPHTWFDPHNVTLWVRNIEHTLSELDPTNAARYRERARAYEARLKELDEWCESQVAQVAEADRKLVTSHTVFSYFAHRYGFTQIGAVFPGYSTLSEPSAKELAELEDAIRAFEVKAVFVGITANAGLAERVANDTGTLLVFLYTASLSEAGGPADDYISLMRYNVSAIVKALR